MDSAENPRMKIPTHLYIMTRVAEAARQLIWCANCNRDAQGRCVDVNRLSTTGATGGALPCSRHDNPQTLEIIMTTAIAQDFDVTKAIKDFTTSTGSGVNMGKHFASLIDYVRATDDTTVIMRLIQTCERKADVAAGRLVLNTFTKIFTGSTATTKNGKMVGIKLNKTAASNSAVEALHTLVSEKVSMRGAKWLKAFKTDTDAKAKPEFDLQAFVLKTMKAHPEVTKAAFSAAFSAAQVKNDL